VNKPDTAATDAVQPTPRRLSSAVRHPIIVGVVLTVVSALVASLIIPSITRAWQDRPRELALKQSLIDEIASATVDPITKTQVAKEPLDEGLSALTLRALGPPAPRA
jgi:hypothetical protein